MGALDAAGTAAGAGAGAAVAIGNGAAAASDDAIVPYICRTNYCMGAGSAWSEWWSRRTACSVATDINGD